jgi:hypothetical protein
MAEDQDIIRARQARELAKKLADQRAAAVTDPLAELQKSVAESKAQVQAKNIEIPTIALEQAVNTGDATSIRAAATALGQAQGLTGSELRTFSYTTTQNALKGEKPTPPAADADFTYDYVWRQDVGGPGGKWVLVKTPILKTSSGGTPGGTPGGSPGGGPGGGGPTGTPATTYTAPDGKIFTDLGAYNAYIAQTAADAKRKAGQSAFDLLRAQFAAYGLEGLVADVEKYIKDGLSQAEFTLRLRTESDAYKKRFAANAQRINKGLRALSEGEYIALEDQYQNVMRNYGLPASYYARGDMGVQQGFEKFIAGDVSAAELEDRIQTAQNRVINAAPEVATSLREFYPEITGGDILAYALDPDKALTEIRRKVGAAEIGAGAKQAGLATGLARAEELQKYGVTAEQARAGYQNIAELLPSATKLSQIYAKQGLGAYDQAVAEQEAFGISGAADAAAKRKRLTQLETAQFSGTSGATGGALGRERAGQF